MGLKDMLLLVAFVLYSADARVLLTESGEMLETTAWLPYSDTLASYPQCCGETKNCQMVRISQEVLKVLTDSPSKLRIEFSGVTAGENLQIGLAYNSELEAASGQASFEGKLYYVAPLTKAERAASPCLVRGQENYMHLFHKLILLGESSGLTPPLITPLKGQVSPSCCKSSEACVKISLEDSLLSQQKSIVRIPLPWRFPQFFSDQLESFKLESTLPFECTGFCDMYNFRGSPHLTAKVTRDGQSKKPVLSISNNGDEYQARFCEADNGYVIATKIDQDASLANLLAIEDNQELVNFEDEFMALSGERTLVAGCNYLGYFCDFNFYQEEVITLPYNESKLTEDYMDECRTFCNNGTSGNCQEFTVWKVWNSVKCFLLSDCLETYVHTCLEEDTCMSGGNNCNGTTKVVSGCQRPTLYSMGYLQWQCVDIEGRVIELSDSDTDLPIGTACFLRCNAWETVGGGQGYLFSECNNQGEWTTTSSLDGNALHWPASPYPLPTAAEGDALECNCQQTVLTWPETNNTYNPNIEEGAAFVCETRPIEKSGNITLQTNDECFFFCDDYLVTEVSCTDGIWSDSIDVGLWCYNKPDFV